MIILTSSMEGASTWTGMGCQNLATQMSRSQTCSSWGGYSPDSTSWALMIARFVAVERTSKSVALYFLGMKPSYLARINLPKLCIFTLPTWNVKHNPGLGTFADSWIVWNWFKLVYLFDARGECFLITWPDKFGKNVYFVRTKLCSFPMVVRVKKLRCWHAVIIL